MTTISTAPSIAVAVTAAAAAAVVVVVVEAEWGRIKQLNNIVDT